MMVVTFKDASFNLAEYPWDALDRAFLGYIRSAEIADEAITAIMEGRSVVLRSSVSPSTGGWTEIGIKPISPFRGEVWLEEVVPYDDGTGQFINGFNGVYHYAA